jgi:hypothetical protein
MARPSWHDRIPVRTSRIAIGWDRFVALWAGVNLLWVVFDLSYVPLRTFWQQRILHPIPAVPLVIPLTFLPDITPLIDPIKGIEPHRETQAYLDHFARLDAAMVAAPAGGTDLTAEQRRLLQEQVSLTQEMVDSNPFQASNASGTLEKLKNALRQRAGLDSSKRSTELLLSPRWLAKHPWPEERVFWQEQILPLVASNYWRSIDENGLPTDHFWRYDLLLFQSVFLLDLLIRAIRMRRRLPGLSWSGAIMRRWIDLPLLLPFWRWLRVVPVLERLQSSGLISIEPLRAVISRAVVALLAVELFEVLALQLLDGLQQVIRSRRWPDRIRALRSHQTVTYNDERELVELMRIWGPLVLVQVAPRLEPELENLLGHALQRSLQNTIIPSPLRHLQPLLAMEKGLSLQIAGGMVDSLLELTRSTGERIGRRDDEQLVLVERCLDRFWEELASALESGPALEESQRLLCTFLEEFKATYLSQISRTGIKSLIEELDQLTVRELPAEGSSTAQE